MAKHIGTAPNQVPTNGMLGTAAFIDKEQLPVSKSQRAAIDLKANAESPVFTGDMQGTTNRASSRPSLVLDLAKTRQLDSRITFSRPGEISTVFDERGVMQTVAENVPRFQHDPVTGESLGFLQEDYSTNRIVSSEKFDDPSWSVYGTGTGLAPVLTSNFEVAPDGKKTVSKITFDTGTGLGSSDRSELRNFQTASLGAVYTLSFYMRGEVGGEQVMIRQAGNVNYMTLTLTSELVRYELTETSAVTTNAGILIGIRQGVTFGGVVVNTSATVYLWGVQFELGNKATSYIPTLAAFSGRNSTATFVGSDGLIQTAPTGTLRYQYAPTELDTVPYALLETQGTNMLAYSEGFDNPVWIKLESLIVPNATLSPDGNMGGAFCYETTATDNHRTQYATSAVVGTQYTASIYAKAGTTNLMQFRLGRTANSERVSANLALGTFSYVGSSLESAKITDVGNGWYRLAVTATLSLTGTQYVAFGPNEGDSVAYAGNSTSGIYVWGAQLETGPVATTYIPTLAIFTGRASSASYVGSDGLVKVANSGVARYESSLANLTAPPYLLLENASTNILLYSEHLNYSGWSGNGILVSQNHGISPEGFNNAVKLVATTGSGYHYRDFISSGPYAIGEVYTQSIFAKPEEYGLLTINSYYATNGGGGKGSNFNLVTGTVVSSSATNAGIVAYPNGWYRCWQSVTVDTSAEPNRLLTRYVLNTSAFTGDGFSGLLVWGAQTEKVDKLTSYKASQVTHTGRASTATFIGSNGLLQVASSDVARYSYNPLNLSLGSKLLIEYPATNEVSYSATHNSISSGASVSGTTEFIDGSSVNVYLAGTGNDPHRVNQSVISGSSANTVATFSVYVKPMSGNDLQTIVLRARSSGPSGTGVQFKIQNSIVSVLGGINSFGSNPPSNPSSIQAFSEPAGNGWYRIGYSGIASTLASERYYSIDLGFAPGDSELTAGTSSSKLAVSGWQVEVGAFATSYIPTTSAQVTRAIDASTSVAALRAADTSTSSQVTRAADTYSVSEVTRGADFASITGKNFADFYRQDEGTFVIEGRSFEASNSGFLLTVWGGSTQDYLGIGYEGVNRIPGTIYWRANGGGLTTGEFARVEAGVPFAIAASFKGNKVAYASQGNLANQTASADLPKVNSLYFRRAGSGSFRTSGIISRLTYFPKQLSETEVKGLGS
jgi:hypothetical protein